MPEHHSENVPEQATPTYRFMHDRVQQAAYLFGNDMEKSSIHLAIGRLWLNVLSADERQGKLFDLVNHLNLGHSLITDPAERLELARLNLKAGRKAKASAAYKPALGYLHAGLDLLGDPDWKPNYSLLLDLHLESAEAAYLGLDFEQMQRHIDVVLERSLTLLDRVKAYEVRISACIAQDKFDEAITTGLFILGQLGVRFVERPRRWHALASFLQTKWALTGKSIAQLSEIPDVTDRRIAAASEILMGLTIAAYYAKPAYFPLFVLKSIRLALKYGYGSAAAGNYATYGMILCSLLGDIKQGARYGELAVRLQERPIMQVIRYRTLFVVHSRIAPWSRPLHETLEPLQQIYLHSLAIGDLEFASTAARNYCHIGFHCGLDLPGLEAKTAEYAAAIALMQRPSIYHAMRLMQQSMLNFIGKVDDPCILKGAACDEIELREMPWIPNNLNFMFTLCSLKLMLCYAFGNYHAARESAIEVQKYIPHAIGSFGISPVYMYDSLTRLTLYGEGTVAERRASLCTVRKNQKKMRHWARHAPANFLHKWHLVEAELARIGGKRTYAIDHYQQAIALAHKHGFPHEEALAQELAGCFHLALGQESAASFHLREARQGYRRWGALAKVHDLEQRYPELLRERDAGQAALTLSEGTLSVTHTGTTGTLDLATVMKSSQALSQEIVLERLLRRLMDLAIENAGAQRGLLLLKTEAGWCIEAEKADSQAPAAVMLGEPLAAVHEERMALSLVHYVMRTRDSVVVHDAQQEALVARDAYVQRHHPRSVLVVPILHQGEAIGMLYLENNAVAGAFTENRLELLRLLASQTAISIENARLYAQMEERVAARTADVVQAMQALKETQQQLVFHEKMASVGALTAGVAHEINNPANFAHVGAQTLKAELERFRRFLLELAGEEAGGPILSPLNQRIDGLLGQTGIIVEGTSRIRDLVKDLRTFSRLDEAEKKAVPIGDSLRSTINLVRTQYAHSTEIRYDLLDNPVLECWPAQLNQVFMNLIVNACQAIEARQRAGDKAPGILQIRSRLEQDRLVLEFEDNGCGMAPEVRDKVFEPFFTTKGVGEGTGLGLSISFGIIEKHHGTIAVRSTPGEGTCFTIHLPLAQNDDAPLTDIHYGNR